MNIKTTIAVGFIILHSAFCLSIHAQVSAFTYQGRLNLDGAPANGLYDFMFRLLNDPTNGAAAPVIQINPGVPVTNGLFTTGMDFGVENINGANRWLEINVRTNGAGSFTTLSPRQLLLPSPYAVHAENASNLLGTLPAAQLIGTIPSAQLSGTYSGAVTFSNPSSSFAGSGAGLINLNVRGGFLTGRINQLPTTFGSAFGAVSGITSATATEQNVTTLSPNEAGTAQNLSVRMSAGPGAGNYVEFILRVNGVDTDVRCSVLGGNTTGTSTGGSVVIPPGSELSIRVESTGSVIPAASVAFGWSFK